MRLTIMRKPEVTRVRVGLPTFRHATLSRGIKIAMTSSISSDFIAIDGKRHTVFQLLRKTGDCLAPCAVVSFCGLTGPMGFDATWDLLPRRNAIIRLARIYRKRNTPQVFRPFNNENIAL